MSCKTFEENLAEYPSGTCMKILQVAWTNAGIFFFKTYTIQGSCMKKSYKTSKQHGEFLQSFHATCKIFSKNSDGKCWPDLSKITFPISFLNFSTSAK